MARIYELLRMRNPLSYFCMFALLGVVALPSAVFAQSSSDTVARQYCPDLATDFFKGSIYHTEDGKPWIEVKVDPEFEQKVLREERKITGDIPLTPVYDLVVRIKPEFNYYCIPGWVEGAEVTAEKLPPFLHVTAALIVGAKDEVVVDPVVFSRADKQDDMGRFIYEREMKGWMNGIASGARLERIITDIGNVHVLITIAKPNGDAEKIKSLVTFSNCVPTWGSGQHEIVGMRDSGTNAQDVVPYFDDVRKIGFAKIEPYASHQDFFSYFVDLKNVVGGVVSPITQIALEAKNTGLRTPTLAAQNNILSRYINASSCPRGTYLLKVGTENNSLPWGVGGIALLNASVRGALIDTEGAQLVAGSRGASDVGIVYVHEFSHTFAGLNDEYVYRAESKNVGIPLRNCSVRPASDFSFKGKLFGSTRFQGCSFRYDAGDKPTARTYYYRPSNVSAMNKDGDEFNVVSCGWILVAIKGGDAKSYFPECAKMDGVIKDGVTAQSVFAPLFTWFEKNAFSPASLTAQAVQFRSGEKVKVLVPESRTPPAELQALVKGEKLEAPERCLDASGQRSFAENPEPFRAGWEREGKCAQGIADATALEGKVADLKQSIGVLQNLIASRELSLKEITGAARLDGLSLSIIPVGEEQNKTYTRGDNIAMACVENALGNAGGMTLPFGVGDATNGALYTETSSRLDALMGTLRQRNLANQKLYTSAAERNSGRVSKAGLDRLTELEETLEKDFIVATQSALSQFHQSTPSGGAIALSVTTEKGADGKEQKCSIPFLLNAIVRTLGVRGDFLKSTVTVDGRVYEHDCIPQAHLLKKMKDGFAASIANFQKKKAKYEKLLQPLERELAALEKSGYNCTNPTLVASGGTPVVKSSGRKRTPAAPLPADSDESRTLSQSGGESSYLIIESFDPNNPWGKIVEIVGAGQDIKDISSLLMFSVEGATDAIGVRKGEEAEVEWEGAESIVSCRGSWSPANKLPASGSAKVVVNESSTVTLSCLDADGAAVTKSVIVSAVNPPIFARVRDAIKDFFAPSSSGGQATMEPLGVSCYGTLGERTDKGQYIEWRANTIGGNGNPTFVWTGVDSLSSDKPVVSKLYEVGGIKAADVRVSSGNAHAACRAVATILDRTPLSIPQLESQNVFFIEVDDKNVSDEEIGRRFYEKYKKDDWEYLAVFLDYTEITGGERSQHHRMTRNDVKGIGIDLFDSSALYGSKGRLRGIGVLLNPRMYNGFVYNALIEEVFAHNFGMFAGWGKGADQLPPIANPQNQAHWSQCMSFPKSDNAAFDYWNAYTWTDNKDGTWTRQNYHSAFEPERLDPFMLYFAGLIPPEQVPTATLLMPLSGDLSECRDKSTISASAKSISVKDIIAVHGERIPSYKDSPKSFSTAFVLVVLKGSPPSDDALKQLAVWSTNWVKVLAVQTVQPVISPPLSDVRAGTSSTPFVRLARAAVSETFQPQFLPIGNSPQALGSFSIFTSEAARLSPPVFRLSSSGSGAGLRGISSFELWQIDPITAISRGGRLSGGEDGVVFRDSVDLRQGTSTFVIIASPVDRFVSGQRLTLSANFYKDDVEATLLATSTASTTPRLLFPKNEVIINTLTAVAPTQTGGGQQPAAQGQTPGVRESTASGLNLIATTPTITGSGAGAGKLYAGTMTFRASIFNEGDSVSQTFNNTLQYRDAAAQGAWTDWVKFEIPGLAAGARGDVTHTWEGGAGEWEFRLVADSASAVVESDEQDNYSAPARASIVARAGEDALQPAPATGTPNLLLRAPVISGRQAGPGKLVVGTMQISGTVVNAGDGSAPPFQILLLYSRNGRDWSDWVRLDSQGLGAGATRQVVYSWQGGAGGWYFKMCEDIKDSCSPASFVEVVPI